MWVNLLRHKNRWKPNSLQLELYHHHVYLLSFLPTLLTSKVNVTCWGQIILHHSICTHSLSTMEMTFCHVEYDQRSGIWLVCLQESNVIPSLRKAHKSCSAWSTHFPGEEESLSELQSSPSSPFRDEETGYRVREEGFTAHYLGSPFIMTRSDTRTEIETSILPNCIVSPGVVQMFTQDFGL